MALYYISNNTENNITYNYFKENIQNTIVKPNHILIKQPKNIQVSSIYSLKLDSSNIINQVIKNDILYGIENTDVIFSFPPSYIRYIQE